MRTLESMRLWSRTDIQTLSVASTACSILNKSLHLFDVLLPQLQNSSTNNFITEGNISVERQNTQGHLSGSFS